MLKGVAHIHSRYSFDGKVPLRDLRRHFEERGLDFVLMSEHIDTMQPSDIRAFVDECRLLSTGKCVLVPGLEMDALHVLYFGIQEPVETPSLLDMATAFHRQGAVIVVSHPVKLHHGLPDGVTELLAGVEVWNCRYDSRQAPRPASVALLRALRRDNPGLIATCGLDFHSPSDDADVQMGVESAARTEGAILAALRAGRCRILRRGRPVAIDPAAGFWDRRYSEVKGRACTAVHDSMRNGYAWLKRRGLRPPAAVRLAGKRIL